MQISIVSSTEMLIQKQSTSKLAISRLLSCIKTLTKGNESFTVNSFCVISNKMETKHFANL